MKAHVYVLIWADPHRDDIVEVHSKKDGALASAEVIRRGLPKPQRDRWAPEEAHDLSPFVRQLGWIFYAKYGLDDDGYSVTVIERQLL